MQNSSDGYCIKTVLSPVLNSICSQNPIKIDWRKLLQLPPNNVQEMQITHYKLAWIQAIIESDIQSFALINWQDHDLLILVNEIQKFFCGSLEAAIQEYLETEDAQKEKLWNKIGIISNEDSSFNSNVCPEYLVSRRVAIQLLKYVAPARFLEEETLNKLVKKQQQKENEARHPALAQLGVIGEVILNIKSYCTENPVKLDVTKLPSRIWLKYLAGYLAIPSTQASHYSDIVYNDNFLNHASRIHIDLRRALNKKLDITIDLFSVMLVDQLKIAEDAGVIDVALVAVNNSGTVFDNLSCEVTRELALDLLRFIPEFNYLFIQNESVMTSNQESLSQNKNVDKPYEDILPTQSSNSYVAPKLKPSLTCQERTISIVSAVEHLLCTDLDHALDSYNIWLTLLTKKNDPAYKIIDIQGAGSKKKIIFAKQEFDYKNATQHIKKVIEWRRCFIFPSIPS